MTEATGFLQSVIAAKSAEVAAGREWRSVQELREAVQYAAPPRGFRSALYDRLLEGRNAVVAEISRAAPGKGLLRDDFLPVELARTLADAGATCLSVATDRDFFQGSTRFLERARDACPLPVLRRDYIIDSWQVYESRLIGSDAILLIAAILDDMKLNEYAGLALELDLDVLMEVHDVDELERALVLPINMISINCREVKPPSDELDATLELAALVPEERITIVDCDITERDVITRMNSADINAFLLGETLMRCKNPAEKYQELFGSQI
ncbi:MAG: indole-3-glycerol phosphate synthase TrpC [Gammaproteobacteria bacterium]